MTIKPKLVLHWLYLVSSNHAWSKLSIFLVLPIPKFTKCFLEPLCKSITTISMTLFHKIENNSNQSFFFGGGGGINTLLKILTNQSFMKDINNIKNEPTATVTSFDISTLYTFIPHSKLYKLLFLLIVFVSKQGKGIIEL